MASGSKNANPSRGAFGPAPKAQDPKVPFNLGQYGPLKSPDPRYLFGTEEEINDREATGYILSGTPPETRPPAFSQIVAGPTSKDLNAPGPVSRQGNSKFGVPRKYA
jgi:hypothetical protein